MARCLTDQTSILEGVSSFEIDGRQIGSAMALVVLVVSRSLSSCDALTALRIEPSTKNNYFLFCS